MSYVDLHLHLLPGVDDGPEDEAASLAHAKRIVEQGVTEATVTPHIAHPWFSVDPTTVTDRTRQLQAALDRERIPLRLHPGGELHPGGAMDLDPRTLDLVAHGPAGARWVLMEAPFGGIGEAFEEATARLRALGLGVVIAHPERADGVSAGVGMAILRRELGFGAVLQVNVCSLLGRHGEEVKLAAQRFVRSGLAYVLASDGHGGERVDTLGAGPAAARAVGASDLQSWQLTQANPRFLLRHGLPAPMLRASGRPWDARGDAERIARTREAVRGRR